MFVSLCRTTVLCKKFRFSIVTFGIFLVTFLKIISVSVPSGPIFSLLLFLLYFNFWSTSSDLHDFECFGRQLFSKWLKVTWNQRITRTFCSGPPIYFTTANVEEKKCIKLAYTSWVTNTIMKLEACSRRQDWWQIVLGWADSLYATNNISMGW